MTEPQRYPSPNLSWPTEEPRLKSPVFQWTLQQGADKFQASRDWSWFQHGPTAPYNTTSGISSYGAPGLPQQRYPGHHDYRPGRQAHGQNQWRKKKTKQNEPEFSHYCDTCDRGFKVQAKYNEHIAQHVKCSVEDCKFTAHEKLVKIHWKNNHSPGAKRIKLDTADEIAKWREERRRNYPTLNNVQKKMKMMEVKEKRGDVLETAQFGRFKTRGCGRGFKHHRGGAYSGHQGFHPKSGTVEQPPLFTCTSQDRDPLGALANSDPDSEKEESAKGLKSAMSVSPKMMTSALGSLMSSYGDMTESESEKEHDDIPILKTALALEENKAMLAAHSHPAQNNAPKFEESKISYKVQHPQFHQSNRWGRGGQRRRGGRREYDPRSGPQKPRPTLLEMLLAPDIRHERNVVLQCVRYVIHNGFFGLASKDSDLVKPAATSSNDNHPVSSNAIQSNQTKECNGAKDHTVVVLGQSQEENSSFVSQDMLCNKTHNMDNAELCIQHSSYVDHGTIDTQGTTLESLDQDGHSQSGAQLLSNSSNQASSEIPQENVCNSLPNEDNVSNDKSKENL